MRFSHGLWVSIITCLSCYLTFYVESHQICIDVSDTLSLANFNGVVKALKMVAVSGAVMANRKLSVMVKRAENTKG